jgi:lysophospholipase L1-like esterase
MGDSITAGQYVPGPDRWTTRVEQRLHAKFGTANITTMTRGVSGETTRMGLERFPAAVQVEKPDVVTIQFGLNDCNCWQSDQGLPRVSLAAFKANLSEMVDRSRRFGANEVILLTNNRTLRPAPMVSGEAYEHANERYSEAIREVAVEADTRLCDVQRAFISFSDQELDLLLLPAPDRLHLSAAGHVFYGDIVCPVVEAAVDTMVSVPK